MIDWLETLLLGAKTASDHGQEGTERERFLPAAEKLNGLQTDEWQSRTEDAVSRSVETVGEPLAGTVQLTAEGLDRLVRRDSRRYDGGMNIY